MTFPREMAEEPQTTESVSGIASVPSTWAGTPAEYIIQRALQRRGLIDGIDFRYAGQDAIGIKVSFLVFRPRVAISVERNRNTNALRAAAIQSSGVRFEVITETEARVDADRAVTRALGGI